jgi:putative tricarboxylic transport membrane protein
LRRAHQIAGAASLVFSIWILIESARLAYYTPLGPGPGFFPLWVALVLAGLSAALVWQGTRSEPRVLPADFFPDRAGTRRVGAILLALAGCMTLMEALGFRLTMAAFYLFLLPALGNRNVALIVVIAAAGSFGVFHLFNDVLQIVLPVGVLGI